MDKKDNYLPALSQDGKADRTIPFSQGQRLYDAAKEPKEFYVPPKGSDYHSAPLGEEHRIKLRAFIEKNFSSACLPGGVSVE
ncbi:MAG: hypothetical protein LBN39_04790 [Planctomycetaceae bacterium]|nr:hypothetical protein [Planctomycetaceae bacterium]